MNELISSYGLLSALFTASIAGALIFTAVWITELTVGKRVSAGAMYFLWGLVALRLIVLFCPASPWSALNATHWFNQTPLRQLTNETINAEAFEISSTAPVLANRPVDESTSMASHSRRSPTSYLSKVLGLIWLVVSLFLVAILVLRGLVTYRLLSRSDPDVPRHVLELLGQCKLRMKLTKVIRIRMSDLDVPAIAGIYRPCILIPRWCADEMNDDQLRLIIAHELIHFRRRDLLTGLVVQVVAIAHWFNPLVYILVQRVARFRELSCDAQVLRIQQLVCHTSNVAKVYGETILQIAARSSEKARQPIRVNRFIGVVGIGIGQTNLRERIQMLSNKRDFSLFAIFCTALLATAMVLVGFTRAQEKNIPNEKTADSAGEQWPIDSKTLPEPSRLLMSPVVFRHAPNGDKIAAEAFDLTENVRQAVEKRHLTETEAWSEIHVLAQQMIAADESNGGLVNEFQPNSYTLVVAAKGQRCWELRGAIDAWAKGIQTNREIVDAWNANAFEMVCLQTRIVQFPPELMPEFLKATGTEKKDFGPNKEIMRSLAMQNLDFIWRFRDDHYDDVELSEETVITMAKGEKTQVERTADIEFDFKKQNELGQFVDSESVETVGMSLEFTTVATQNPKSLTVGLVAEDRLLKAKCDGKLEPDRWVRRLSTGWELEYGQSAVVAFQTKDVLDNPGDKTADQAKDVIKAILITVTPVGGTFIRN